MDASTRAAANLISDLVRIPSLNPPGNEAACARFVLDYLAEKGITARTVARPYPHRPQVLGVIGSGSGPDLALNGHMDVVPEGDVGEWSRPPFSGDIADGRVFGRGATDMKGGLATMMLAAGTLAAESATWTGTLLLQFAVGEETGSPGTLELLKEGPRPDWGIVLEPSELSVGVAARGVTWWEMKTKGRAVHAGHAADGLNAIELARGMLANAAAYQRELERRDAHPLLGTPSCTVTMIEGGTKENVVPSECLVVLDRRLIPGESVAQVEAEVRALWPDDCAGRCETRCRQLYEAAETDPDDRLVRQIRSSMKRIAGRDPGVFGLSGSTDARNFINDFAVPAVIWGPGDLRGAHVADESIAVDEVVLAVDVLVDVCRGLLA